MRKIYENSGWGKRERSFGFGRAKPGTKLLRRMDPNVGSFTRLRDQIREQKKIILDPPPERVAEKMVRFGNLRPQERLTRLAKLVEVRDRLRHRILPTHKRRQLEQLEAELSIELDLLD